MKSVNVSLINANAKNVKNPVAEIKTLQLRKKNGKKTKKNI